MGSGPLFPRARLASGLVLMAFTTGHLLDAALGLVSIETMERGRAVLLSPWQTPPGLVLLYGALLVHIVLGLATLVRRIALRPTAIDIVQTVAGLAVPFLLLAHLMATRAARTLAPFQPDYGWILSVYWRWAPDYGLQQVLLVAVVWMHGCIGLLSWLRLRPWWPKVSAFTYPPVFALPILALFGFVHGGDEALSRLSDDADFIDRVTEQSRIGFTVLPTILTWQHAILVAYGLLAGLAILPFLRRILAERWSRRSVALLSYLDGPTVEAATGSTILDVSRRHAVPHSAVCSGHARCATCRVRVLQGGETLSPIGPEEAAKLAQIHAGPDVRLACRANLLAPTLVAVERLVPIEEAEAEAQRPGRTAAEPPVLAPAEITP